MAWNQLKNSIRGTLTAGINDAVTAMGVTLATGSATYPTPIDADNPIYLTIHHADNILQHEIVKVTAVTGANVTTMVRAQRGTAAASWAAGSIIALNLHAQDIDEMRTVVGSDSSVTCTTLDVGGSDATIDADGNLVCADITATTGTITTLDGTTATYTDLLATTLDVGGGDCTVDADGNITATDITATTGDIDTLACNTFDVGASSATISALGAIVGSAITATTGTITTLACTTLDVGGSDCTVNADGEIAAADITATTGTITTLGSTTGTIATLACTTLDVGGTDATIDADGNLVCAGATCATLDVGGSDCTINADGDIDAGDITGGVGTFDTLDVATSNCTVNADGDIACVDITSSGLGNFAAGAVGAPSIYLSTDTTTGIYRAAANQVAITVSGTQRLLVSSNGVDATGGRLSVTNSAAATAINMYCYRDSTELGIFQCYSARGTLASPACLQTHDRISGIYARAWQTGTTFGSTGVLRWMATENHSSTANGCKCQIYITPNTTASAALGLEIGQDKSVTTYGDEVMASTAYKYIGGATTTGTWRIGRDGDDLVFERYSGAAWVEKFIIES